MALVLLVGCSGRQDSTIRTTTPVTSTPVVVQVPMAIAAVQPPEVSTVEGLLALTRPVVIAHAGGDFESPHATMFAFTRAALAGADVLEMDVSLSSDGVLMVQHDNTVDRLTNSTGLVSSFSAAELGAMDNAYWFSGGVWSDKSLTDDAYIYRGVRTGERPAPEGYAPDDFGIATFASVAAAFPNFVLDVDIKIPETATGEVDLDRAIAAARELAKQIVLLERTSSVLVVSFDDRVLTAFREAAPEVATSPGTDSLTAWYLGTENALAPQDVIFQAPPVYNGLEVLTTETFVRAHAQGFKVWVWMDDSAEETELFYRELIGRGADGLLVSLPSVGVAALR